MKEYKKLDVDGTVFQIGAISFPKDPDNMDYARMLEEVTAGTARILDYEPPPRTWNRIRWERDRLMAETDWWAVADRSLTSEQTAYRKALRDIPQDFDNPSDVVWPTKP